MTVIGGGRQLPLEEYHGPAGHVVMTANRECERRRSRPQIFNQVLVIFRDSGVHHANDDGS
jgi:hypothetical protein